MLIDLEERELRQLLTLLAKYVVWELANPLIVKINKQMQGNQTPESVAAKRKGDNHERIAVKS